MQFINNLMSRAFSHPPHLYGLYPGTPSPFPPLLTSLCGATTPTTSGWPGLTSANELERHVPSVSGESQFLALGVEFQRSVITDGAGVTGMTNYRIGPHRSTSDLN